MFYKKWQFLPSIKDEVSCCKHVVLLIKDGAEIAILHFASHLQKKILDLNFLIRPLYGTQKTSHFHCIVCFNFIFLKERKRCLISHELDAASPQLLLFTLVKKISPGIWWEKRISANSVPFKNRHFSVYWLFNPFFRLFFFSSSFQSMHKTLRQ